MKVPFPPHPANPKSDQKKQKPIKTAANSGGDFQSEAMSSNDPMKTSGHDSSEMPNLIGKGATKEIAKMNLTRQKLEQTIK
jgi:hypothetical protein